MVKETKKKEENKYILSSFDFFILVHCLALGTWHLALFFSARSFVLAKPQHRLYIGGQLLCKGGNGIERAGFPHAGEKFNLKRLTVQTAAETGQVRFELERLLAEGRIGTNVDRRRPDSLSSKCSPRVDANRRH